MTIEKIETIRVRVRDGYYVDVTPDHQNDGYFEFVLRRDGYGASEFMFGCRAESESDILDLIESNVEDYIADFEANNESEG